MKGLAFENRIAITLPDEGGDEAWLGSPLDQGQRLIAALERADCQVLVSRTTDPVEQRVAVEISFHPRGLFTASHAELRVVLQVHAQLLEADEGVVSEVPSAERLLQVQGSAYLAAPAPRRTEMHSPGADAPYACLILAEESQGAAAFVLEMAKQMSGSLPLVCLAPSELELSNPAGARVIGGLHPGYAWALATEAALLVHIDLVTAPGACSPAGLLAQRWGVPVLALADRPGTQAAALVEDGVTGFLRARLSELPGLLPHVLELDRQRILKRSEARLGPIAAANVRIRAWRRLLGAAR